MIILGWEALREWSILPKKTMQHWPLHKCRCVHNVGSVLMVIIYIISDYKKLKLPHQFLCKRIQTELYTNHRYISINLVNWYSLHTWPWICNDMYLTCDLWLFVIFLSSAITNYGKNMTIDGVHVQIYDFSPFFWSHFSRLYTTRTCAGPCTCVWFPERWLVHVQALVVCRCTWAWCIFFIIV